MQNLHLLCLISKMDFKNDSYICLESTDQPNLVNQNSFVKLVFILENPLKFLCCVLPLGERQKSSLHNVISRLHLVAISWGNPKRRIPTQNNTVCFLFSHISNFSFFSPFTRKTNFFSLKVINHYFYVYLLLVCCGTSSDLTI